VLFLDEPSIGIDPVGARELRATVAGLASGGTTVLLTTHYMFEADELCDRIAVIAGGRLVAQGTPADLKRGVTTSHVLEAEVFGDAGPALAGVRALPGVTAVSVEESGQAQVLVVRSTGSADLEPQLRQALDGLTLGRVAGRAPTLEDAYVELVGRAG